MSQSCFKKALTFSYDDGVTQDRRLVELFNKYGMKCTFNINSAFLGQSGSLFRNNTTVRHDKVAPEEIATLYKGHEVAVHALHHPDLCKLTREEIITEVEEDRIALSELAGYEVVGMAYPGGTHDERVARVLRKDTGILYSRTVTSTYAFGPQSNLIEFNPSVYHLEMDKMFSLGREFLELQPETPQVYYVWGHSYEFDGWDFWDKFEDFLRMMAGREDIFYGTNAEVLLSTEWVK